MQLKKLEFLRSDKKKLRISEKKRIKIHYLTNMKSMNL